MEKALDLINFYEYKEKYIPANIQSELGHFNVFKLDGFSGDENKCQSFRRLQFYKICLFTGHHRFKYGDQVITFDQPALLFINPQVPYSMETITGSMSGYYCLFTATFFNELSSLLKFHIFQRDGNPVFLLSGVQFKTFSAIFEDMLGNITSDYVYKYDLLRAQVQLLVHEALKVQPFVQQPRTAINAAARITAAFVELLEVQFPIESTMQRIAYRHPAEFAEKLAVTVNHLNKCLKEALGHTTVTLITNRIMTEARTLLKNTTWNVSEIGWCLGFDEAAHFISFFKKHAGLPPNAFRAS